MAADCGLMLAARKRLGNRVDLPCSVCPVLALRGSFAEQLSAADAKFRRNLRTARKRLEQAGEVKYRAADASSLDDLGEAGQLATAGLQAFHRDFARRFLGGERTEVRFPTVRRGIPSVRGGRRTGLRGGCGSHAARQTKLRRSDPVGCLERSAEVRVARETAGESDLREVDVPAQHRLGTLEA